MAKFIVLLCFAALLCVVTAREQRKVRSARLVGMGGGPNSGARYQAGMQGSSPFADDDGQAHPASYSGRLGQGKMGRWAQGIHRTRQDMMDRHSRLANRIPQSVMENLRAARRMRQNQGQQMDVSDLRAAFQQANADQSNPGWELQLQTLEQALEQRQNRRPAQYHGFRNGMRGQGRYRGGHTQMGGLGQFDQNGDVESQTVRGETGPGEGPP